MRGVFATPKAHLWLANAFRAYGIKCAHPGMYAAARMEEAERSLERGLLPAIEIEPELLPKYMLNCKMTWPRNGIIIAIPEEYFINK